MRYLFVDKILDLQKGKSTVGIKKITKEDYYLICESNDYFFMPSLIGEALGQLTAYNVMYANNFQTRPVAGIVSKASLIRPVKVGETLTLKSWIDSLDEKAVQYHGSVYVNEREVFRLESALGPLLPMNDFIDDEDIKNQFKDVMNATHKATSSQQIQSMQNDIAFDSVIDFEPGKRLSMTKLIKKDEPFFSDHFPKKPVLPMTMLLEFKRNLANLFFLKSNISENYQLKELSKVKMNDFINPHEEITCSLILKKHLDGQMIINFVTHVRNKRVCVTEAIFGLREEH